MDITVNVSNLSTIDRQAAIHKIEEENLRRAKQTPPGTPLPLTTAAEIKASYETVWVAIDQAAHLGHITQSAENNATAKQLRELLRTPLTQTQLNAMLAAGTT